MRFNFQQFLKAVVLAGFAIYIIHLHSTGDITKYINPKYELLSQTAAGFFIFFFIIQLFRIWKDTDHQHEHCEAECSHDHGQSSSALKKIVSYSIIIFPLLTGFTLSPSVLDASIAEKKGTMLPRAAAQQEAESERTIEEIESSIASYESDQLTEEAEELGTYEDEALPNDNYIPEGEFDEKMNKLMESEVIQMEDDIYLAYHDTIYLEPKEYIGKKLKIHGFVYKEEGLSANQLVVSRFVITHCIADAGIIGFITEFEEASQYEPDTWLEIEGTLDVSTYNGFEIPLIKAEQWKVIERPDKPYVYPAVTSIVE